MEQKIKDIILLLVAVGIAFLGYYYYQNYFHSVVNEESKNEVVKENIDEKDLEDSVSGVTQKIVNPNSESQLPSVTKDGVYLVYYFNDGFYPNVLQVRQGSSVRFINKSDNSMRIFTTNDQEYRFNQLNQSQTVGKGGTYDFTFIDKGIWNYFNQNVQSHHASVLVY